MALLCPYEMEDPAFQRSGRLPSLRHGDQVRAVWVSRYDFHSSEDIVRIMERSAQAGFNTVFFQVRGNASTYYPSKVEPWSEVYQWRSPGFDPLQLAVGEAHAKGMALHAWINVMPLWRGLVPPSNPDHLYCSKAEWSWYDAQGGRQPLTGAFYVSLNPCLPQARSHILEVCKEIVSGYQIDGLHLDYIRFPNESPVVDGKQYPRDPQTLQLFKADTGLRSPEEKPEVWDQWRCDCVTALLRDIRRTCKSLHPHIVLTAAVGAERKQALSKFQDVERWWKERLLDAVVPMNYTSCPRKFRIRVEHEWQQQSSNNRKRRSREVVNRGGGEWCCPPEPAIIMGASLEFGDSRLHQKQLALALQKFGHFSVFCYSTLFGLNCSPDMKMTTTTTTKQQQHKGSLQLLPFLKILADASLLLVPRPVGGHRPFRGGGGGGGDIAAHPEEAFPYDQLHLYNQVPPDAAYEHGSSHSQEKRRRWSRQHQSGLKVHRRTCRRGLREKQKKKESYVDACLAKSKIANNAPSPGDAEFLVPMHNWEAVNMSSEATHSDTKTGVSRTFGLRQHHDISTTPHHSSRTNSSRVDNPPPPLCCISARTHVNTPFHQMLIGLKHLAAANFSTAFQPLFLHLLGERGRRRRS